MQLLEYLCQNKGQVLGKEQIFDKIWGFNNDVELYVFYLRKKIKFKENHLNLKTIRGIGYCLEEYHD